MDTITAIRTLRVVRSYADKPLTEDEVRAIADTARKTGSSKNTQRWDFVTMRDRVSLARLGGVTIHAKHLPHAGAAIALIVDKPDPDYPRSVLWDLGRAAQNIMLSGVGDGHRLMSHHGAGLRPGRGRAGPAHDKECQYIIALGWPADPDDLKRPPKAGGRKAYDEVVHTERWGEH